MNTTAWILIVFFKYGYAGGTSTATFKDFESCKVAAEWVNRDVREWATTAKAACFPASK